MPNLPTLIVDSREQAPLVFTRLQSRPGTLTTGDYSFAGAEELFAIERKSIADLVGSVMQGRERFERELARLRGYEFRRLLVIGTRDDIASGRYVSQANPKAVLASVDTFEVRYSTPVVWEPDATVAAALIERWACYFAAEVRKRADRLTRPPSHANRRPATHPRSTLNRPA